MHLQDLHRNMLRDNISFCFTGYMSEDVLVGIGNTLRKKFELDSIDRSTSKAMFSIFVEMVQNVIRYSAENKLAEIEPPIIDLRYGILAIGERDGLHYVACGNLIQDSDMERLTGNLAEIKDLDQEGLKALYKEVLKGDVPEGSKGAGVGFLEIARRAKNGFEYSFEPAGDGRQFFSISAFL